MSYFNKCSSSGVFLPSGNGFVEYKGDKGSGSINAITIALGYHPDQVYSPRYGDLKQRINCVIFEIFTRNIVCVLTNDKTTCITDRDIRKFLGDFSVTKEFTSLKINDTLTQGVENASLTIDYLAKVLKLKNVSRNGMFYAERIHAYLYFTESLLTDFQYDDGLFPMAKFLRGANKTVYEWIADMAYKYWPDDEFQAKKEINIQCAAWSAIPDAFGNEYLNLHRTENGGANLHMIRVCHYGYPITLPQFKEINHGRYRTIKETDGALTVQSGNFLYVFDISTEELLSISLLQGK